MTLNDVLNRLGIRWPSGRVRGTRVSNGVQLLLQRLSVRDSADGRATYVDPVLLSGEWPASLSQTFEQVIEEAVFDELIVRGPTGYALTDKGKKIAG